MVGGTSRRSGTSRHSRGLGLAPARSRRHYRSRRHSYGAERGRRLGAALAVVVLAFGIFVAVQELRPTPSVSVGAVSSPAPVHGSLSLPWPKVGEAALAVGGEGIVGTSGPSTPEPIASIAKVMTALVVLHDRPIQPGGAGPTITITPAEVAQYQRDVATQQSVAAVAAGERLSEFQALEALLIPSANNVADVLASFAAGSRAAFVAQMNHEATVLGLSHTHFVDPSGLDAGTVSTATDLVHLGEVAMANPVFASIVRMAEVTLPVAGTVVNYDYNIGHYGFVGIKTGSDGPAGGCFLFEDVRQSPAGTVHLFGAVLGQQKPPIVQSALNASTVLVRALGRQVELRALVRAGEAVGTVRAPWGASVPVLAARTVTVRAWPGLVPHASIRAAKLGSSVRDHQAVGTMTLTYGSPAYASPAYASRAYASRTVQVPVVAGGNLSPPSFAWRLSQL